MPNQTSVQNVEAADTDPIQNENNDHLPVLNFSSSSWEKAQLYNERGIGKELVEECRLEIKLLYKSLLS